MSRKFIKSIKELEALPQGTIVRGLIEQDGEKDATGELIDFQPYASLDFVARDNGAFKVFVNNSDAMDRNSSKKLFNRFDYGIEVIQ